MSKSVNESITESLTEIDNAVQAVLDRHTEYVSDLEAKIANAKEMQGKAKEDAAKAYAAADVDAYHDAQDEDRSAKDAETMYQQQLESALKNTMLSDADYQNYLSHIMQILAEDVQDKKDKIIGLLDQIISIAEDNQKNIEAGNKIIHKLQHDVMKDVDCTHYDTNGNAIHIFPFEKKFEDYSAAAFSSVIKDSYCYRKAKGNV